MTLLSLKKIPLLLRQSLLQEKSPRVRYGFALSFNAVFLILCAALRALHFNVPFSVLFSINLMASALAALFGGIGPGLVATAVGLAGIDGLFPSPSNTNELKMLELVHDLNFALTSGLAAVLIADLMASYRKTHLAMREAEKSKLFMDELIAVVSHDLKAPLTTITLKTELLSREFGPQKHVEEIKKTAMGMSRMINHLLDSEKVRSGRLLASQLEVENVNPLLAETLAALEPLAASKAIQLKCSMDDPEIPVRCDRIRVGQVFYNLIENAIKYCASGDTIFVETRILGDDFRCLISDSGPGIDPKHLPHVFERFWQAKPGARQGVGLGLSIVKAIVEAHGGEISVRSQLDLGTSFVFTLPLAAEANGLTHNLAIAERHRLQRS